MPKNATRNPRGTPIALRNPAAMTQSRRLASCSRRLASASLRLAELCGGANRLNRGQENAVVDEVLVAVYETHVRRDRRERAALLYETGRMRQFHSLLPVRRVAAVKNTVDDVLVRR